MPPPVQVAGRAFRFGGARDLVRAEPDSPKRPLPQPSPRRLAPLAGGATVEQDEAKSVSVQATYASEADVAAGESSGCGSVSAPMELEDHGSSSGKQYSWAKELHQLRPLVGTPEAAAGGSGDPGGEADASRCDARSFSKELSSRRQTHEVLADALATEKQRNDKAVRSPRNQKKRGHAGSTPRKSVKNDDEDMGATATFWHAYKSSPLQHRGRRIEGPAWEEVCPEKGIAWRQELDGAHGKRRLKLMRLIKTGQLPAARALVATGGQTPSPRPQHDVDDQVKKQLEVMSVQRRGLTEARKTLEKLVLEPKPSKDIEIQNLLKGGLLKGGFKRASAIQASKNSPPPDEEEDDEASDV